MTIKEEVEGVPDDDYRFTKLEAHAIKTEGRIETIERTQVQHSAKLDQIFTAVTKAEGRPVFDIWRAVSSLRDVVLLAGSVGTLAVWLVLTLTAANTRVTEERLAFQKELSGERYELINLRFKALDERTDWLRDRFNWKPSFELAGK